MDHCRGADFVQAYLRCIRLAPGQMVAEVIAPSKLSRHMQLGQNCTKVVYMLQ